MNKLSRLLGSVTVLTFTTYAIAQPPGGGRGQGGFNNGRTGVSPVDRLMMMDTNGDGQLTADEVTDMRLRAMLNRADANQDGIVTRAELSAITGGQPDNAAQGREQGFGGGQRGPGGPPPGGMPGGPGEFGPPQVGQILPPFIQDQLELTTDQRAAIAQLQAEVDAQLSRILTAQQQQQMQRGPGGPGGPQELNQGQEQRAGGRGQRRPPAER
ncbi:hypothetical protein [Allorhodopirellula heiligendammensis]|uniref:EF hand n=1 Tax=Allorhodopirellula heiligendammensis TaxID=2714739 RepID=A0A5C6BZS1_9BACT|nr:hypothetical protein [Allorhodopirellula heiligendammensis]TWU16434.1 EF hand [Allorhodopirellula heiligendammensis]